MAKYLDEDGAKLICETLSTTGGKVHDCAFAQLSDLIRRKQLVPNDLYVVEYDPSMSIVNVGIGGLERIYGLKFKLVFKARTEDSYFPEVTSPDFPGMRIWYSFDSTKYDWIRPTTGGIVRMIDKYNNDAPFDFLNISPFTIDEQFAPFFYNWLMDINDYGQYMWNNKIYPSISSNKFIVPMIRINCAPNSKCYNNIFYPGVTVDIASSSKVYNNVVLPGQYWTESGQDPGNYQNRIIHYAMM